MSQDRELLTKAKAAIMAVYGAFGRPGEYGYYSPEGKALTALYDLNNEIADQLAKPPTDLLAPLTALVHGFESYENVDPLLAAARAAIAKAGAK